MVNTFPWKCTEKHKKVWHFVETNPELKVAFIAFDQIRIPENLTFLVLLYSCFIKRKLLCIYQNLLWNIVWADISHPVGILGHRRHNFRVSCSPVLSAWLFCSPQSRLQPDPPPPLHHPAWQRWMNLPGCFDVGFLTWKMSCRLALLPAPAAESGPLLSSGTWTVWTRLQLKDRH